MNNSASMITSPSRRFVLAAGAASLTVSSAATVWAQTATTRPLIIVILRGGMDGLAAVSRPMDSQFMDIRRAFVPTPTEALNLSDGFALHPALQTLHQFYKKGQAAIVHASGMPGASRSHFQAQDLMETGHARSQNGWLNRALGQGRDQGDALSIGAAIPLILRGDFPVGNWSPDVLPTASDDTLTRLMDLYAGDDILGPALAKAMELDDRVGMSGMTKMRPARNRQNPSPLFSAAAKLIKTGTAGVAVISLSGWDTHANQGNVSGQFANRLKGLDDGLKALQAEMGGPLWSRTAVIVMTEFGRTARINGSNGTDHGTASATFLLGGAVNGGKIYGDWPGLSAGALYENRDLAIANDLRAVIKGVLHDHWQVETTDLASHVFPGTQSVAPMTGLIKPT